MVHTLERDERQAGGFAPIGRPRVTERLNGLANYPVVLLIAPAGYGKSVALRQYLESTVEPSVLFTLRSEHATLLGFLRGLTEALGTVAPHAITTLAGAFERNRSSSRRASDLAHWMQAHLGNHKGVVAIDDLHVAENDSEVARFISALIEGTKECVRWILASRSTTGLPVGTWLAYRDADLPLDERDLRFTLEETRNAAQGLGLSKSDDELKELLGLTDAWPAAMSFALRMSTRSSELRSVSALTREMIYRLLEEQVYAGLDDEERGFLEVAVVLPTIDVSVLERAGYDRALTLAERLRERTGLIYEESPGIYQCHELFRDFLRHQTALGGKHSTQRAQARAAEALEAIGDVEHAITAYVAAGSMVDVVRLLEKHGFDLLERARGDIVGRAIDTLDERTRRDNATVLALQGALHAIAGRFARAESMLRRALTRAGDNRDLVAIASLRLASIMANQGQDVGPVLEPVAKDGNQRPDSIAEALSLMSAGRAISGTTEDLASVAIVIEQFIPQIDSDATRARVLHHLGILYRHLGRTRKAFRTLVQSSELASELHFYGLSSRTYAVLSNLVLHEDDDVAKQLRFAKLAEEAARKSGDAFALQTALLQLLSAYSRLGDDSELRAAQARISMLPLNGLAKRYMAYFKAIGHASVSEFGLAAELLSRCWNEMPLAVDRVYSGALYALVLALSGRRDQSISHTQSVLDLVPSVGTTGLFDARAVATSVVFCALADIANGRSTMAERSLRILRAEDPVEAAVVGLARRRLRAYRSDCVVREDEMALIKRLAELNYCDVAKVLASVAQRLQLKSDLEEAENAAILTSAERDALRYLASGLAPKDIASETNRSVHTVRVHIASSIAKLGCHSRGQAIELAKRRGLL